MGNIIARANGTMENSVPANGTDYTLNELQRIVGGPIEIVNLGNFLLVVNEEGKLRRLPYNMIATNWYLSFHFGVGVIPESEYIVGDALLCKHECIK